MFFIRSFEEKPLIFIGIQVLSLRPKRINKIIVNNIINLTVTLILLTGCLWQIITIFQLYLSYPTNIFIETKFKSYRKHLPAITLIVNIGDQSGVSTDEIFRNNSYQDYVNLMVHLESDMGLNNLYENISQNIIESVGKFYFCFTLNSLNKCEFQFGIVIENPKLILLNFSKEH